ncbi:MAG: hypothetical protein R3314_07625 [Longimicrobiales bacterium]|nr:hypothetical protein [Longimicrobiales bacterium]
MGACDNVEWGGIDLDVVPPPPHERERTEATPANGLPAGPILFYVHRDSARTTVIPVGQITEDGLVPITPGDEVDDFGSRFIDAFLDAGTELALFRRGQRVGTLTVEAAAIPSDPVCRPLPRATGSMELASGAGAVTEFLALPATDAPESRSAADLQPVRSMEIVGDMLAGDMLRTREADIPSAATARRQLQPFPLTGSPDPGFTATYLVDDSMGLGGDDEGAALFVVFTPRGQSGYEPAFVGFSEYASDGKAAPRVIDFLDWDRDGAVEILLEIFGTSTSWFRAVGLEDGSWRAIFEQRCDPRTATVTPDTTDAPGNGEPAPRPARRPQPQSMPDLDAIPEPTIQLSNPGETPRVRRDTLPRDTGGGGR